MWRQLVGLLVVKYSMVNHGFKKINIVLLIELGMNVPNDVDDSLFSEPSVHSGNQEYNKEKHSQVSGTPQ